MTAHHMLIYGKQRPILLIAMLLLIIIIFTIVVNFQYCCHFHHHNDDDLGCEEPGADSPTWNCGEMAVKEAGMGSAQPCAKVII